MSVVMVLSALLLFHAATRNVVECLEHLEQPRDWFDISITIEQN